MIPFTAAVVFQGSAKVSFPYSNEHFLSVSSKFHVSGYICLFVCLLTSKLYLPGFQLQSKVDIANPLISCPMFQHFSSILLTLSPAQFSKHCLRYKTCFFGSFTSHICCTGAEEKKICLIVLPKSSDLFSPLSPS